MKKTLKKIIIGIGIFLTIIFIVMFSKMYLTSNQTYAKENNTQPYKEVRVSTAKEIDLENIIEKNTKDGQYEEITKKEEVLEYLTKYRTNTKIPKGISYVVQEGLQGMQEIIIKKTYDKNGKMLKKEQVGTNIIKGSSNKIIEIGGASFSGTNKVNVGSKIYVTSDVLGLWSKPSEKSRKITTLNQNTKAKVLEISKDKNWYKVLSENDIGWLKSECTLNINVIDKPKTSNSTKASKGKLNFGMSLNKPSGLSLDHFKKMLKDNKDKNKIFENNAQYFYYIEKQYNINGVFVAAIGIHESAWGTSKIARDKNNLFGYGAYDSNPYNGAYSFANYSESIDLIARVLVKYYLNPKGTNIYGGEKAVGTYYNGSTLSSVNKRYATDKNWANGVYYHMKYLYSKI